MFIYQYLIWYLNIILILDVYECIVAEKIHKGFFHFEIENPDFTECYYSVTMQTQNTFIDPCHLIFFHNKHK